MSPPLTGHGQLESPRTRRFAICIHTPIGPHIGQFLEISLVRFVSSAFNNPIPRHHPRQRLCSPVAFLLGTVCAVNIPPFPLSSSRLSYSFYVSRHHTRQPQTQLSLHHTQQHNGTTSSSTNYYIQQYSTVWYPNHSFSRQGYV
jgi:hypothetical protein